MKNETSLLTVPSRSSLRKHAVYGILALVSLLGLGMTQSARAFNVTLQQVGSNVVATGSGAFDLTGLTFAFSGGGPIDIQANIGYILLGASGSGDVYGGFTGPANFGSGAAPFFPDASSGDAAAMSAAQGLLLVPLGYVSGNALSDSMTFNNETFASLGVTPGTYVWTWGTGANQNFTLQIGGAVPDGGSTVGLLGFALAGLGILRRKLRC